METPPSPPSPPSSSNSNQEPSPSSNKPPTNKYDSMAFRKRVLEPPKVYQPPLSPGKFKFLVGVTCTISIYLCFVSEFGENGEVNPTVTTGFRKKHDEILSKILGFDIRAKIRDLEKSLFTIKDSAGNLVGDLSNIKIGINNSATNNNSNNIVTTTPIPTTTENNSNNSSSNSNNSNNNSDKKENKFLKSITGSGTIKRTPINYSSQQELVELRLEESRIKEREMELELEKEVERQMKLREERKNNKK